MQGGFPVGQENSVSENQRRGREETPACKSSTENYIVEAQFRSVLSDLSFSKSDFSHPSQSSHSSLRNGDIGKGEINCQCHLGFCKHNPPPCICAVLIFQFSLIHFTYEHFSVASTGLHTAPRKIWL